MSNSLAPGVMERFKTAPIDDRIIALFTGSNQKTVEEWRKGRLPGGGRFNRLVHLLATAGIALPELDELSEFARYLGKLLAFGVIDQARVQEICGEVNSQAIWQWTRGEHRPMRNEADLLDTLRAHDGELVEKVADLQRQLGQPAASTPKPAQRRTIQRAPSTDPATSSRLDAQALQFSRRLASVLPDLRFLVSNDCSPELRARVRRLLGDMGALEFASYTEQLCGERARTINRGR